MWDPSAPLVLSDDERHQVEGWAYAPATPAAVGTRCRIILLAADGRSNSEIARELRVSRPTVLLWRRRFTEGGPAALIQIAAGRGRKPRIPSATAAQIVRDTLYTRAPDGRRWTSRSLASEHGVSAATVRRTWDVHGIDPQRDATTDRAALATDSALVGVFVDLPYRALALCVEEHVLPPDGSYESLVATLDEIDPPVVGRPARERNEALLRFLRTLDREFAAPLHLHVLLLDTPRQDRIDRWFGSRDRFHQHLTPPDTDHHHVVGSLRSTRRSNGPGPHVPAQLHTAIDRSSSSTPFVWTARAQGLLVPAAGPSRASHPRQGPPLLRREKEMAQLLGTLRDADDVPRIAIIRGEAGIGKSRLLEGFLDEARGRGARVIAGRAGAVERSIPYAAVHHALTNLGTAVPDEVKHLATSLLDAITRPAAGDDQDIDGRPAVALHAANRLFGRLTERERVVLAVDDLHAADEETLALLAALARRQSAIPMIMVFSVRDDLPAPVPALDRFLAQVGADCLVETVEPRPLREKHVAQLTEALTGSAPELEVIADVLARSGGNPFFVAEVIEALRYSGGLVVGSDGRLKIGDHHGRPSRWDAVIGRLDPLGDAPVALARVLCVLGDIRLAYLDAAGAVAGLTHDECETAFDGLIRARILTEHADGSFEFRHRLVQEALRADLGPARSRRTHSALTSELLRVRESAGTVELTLIARHAIDAASGPDERAAALAESAADELVSFAPASAASWYERAVELTTRSSGMHAVRKARQARALIRAELLAEGIETGRETLVRLPDGHERTRCVLAVVEALLRCGDGAGALTLLDAEERRGRSHPRRLVDRVSALTMLGRCTEATTIVEAARRDCTPGSMEHLLALAHATQLTSHQARPDEMDALIDELLRLAPWTPHHVRQFLYGLTAFILAIECQLNRADEVIDRARELAEPDAPLDDRIEVAIALVELQRGEWDTALERAVGETARLHSARTSTPYLQSIEATIRSSRGDLQGAREAAYRSYPQIATLPRALVHHVRGWVELLDGRPEQARTELEAGLALANEAVSIRIPLAAQLARARHHLGDEAAAAEQLDACAPAEEGALGVRLRIAALLARAEVTHDATAARAAYKAARSATMPFDAGQAQLLRGMLDDQPEETLADAWRTFSRLSATLWRARAAVALRERNLPVPRVSRPTSESTRLTSTEREIVQLIGEGLRNREIADRLSYSRRTVDTYISQIYAKTGYSSRHMLTRAIDRGAVL